MVETKDLNVDLLRDLSEAFGPSGYEHRTVKVIKDYIEPYVDKITFDKTGSCIFEKQGTEKGPVILLAAHVDEIGFIITHITDNGFLRFHTIGAWSNQTLLGQRVTILTRRGKKMTGVICAVPDILFPKKSGGSITKDEMFIDIGCSSKDEIKELGIRLGDPAVPLSQFELVKDGKVAMGKAFDDRVGVFVILETLRFLKELNIPHANCVVGAATVQEEVGIRGAKTTVATVKPDLAFAIEADVAADVPGIPENKAPAKMGQGFSILVYDGTMIPNIFLREYIIDLAEESQVKHQLSFIELGGTDAGVFHLYKRGCPSLVLATPCRNMHTHVGLVSLEDITSLVNFLLESLQKLDHKRVESFTQFVK